MLAKEEIMSKKIPTIHIGKSAPEFSLMNQEHKTISLSDFQGKWVVLFFYPKNNTPSCTRLIKYLSTNQDHFENKNAVIVGISRNTPKSHSNFIQKNNFTCMLLSDPNREAILKYQAWGKKRLLDQTHVGVKRTTYIIDPDGIVRYKFTNIRIASHAEEILAKLEKLQSVPGEHVS